MNNKVNLKQAKTIIEVSYKIGKSVLLLGSPGLGKTSIFYQLNLPIEVHEGPGLDETDVKGFVFPSKNGEEAHYSKSVLYPKFQKGILLIDELAAAEKPVQVALHSLFGERRLGPHFLPKEVVPMATGNRPKDGAGSRRILRALEDRLTILEIEPDVDVWINDFAIPNNIHNLIISFLSIDANQDLLTTFEKVEINEPFSSPRSWEIVSQYLYKFEEDKSFNKLSSIEQNKILNAILYTKLGAEATQKFLSFRKYKDIFKYAMPLLEKGYIKINMPELEGDKLMALASQIKTIILKEAGNQSQKIISYMKNGLEYLKKMDATLGFNLLNYFIKHVEDENIKNAVLNLNTIDFFQEEYNALM